MTGPSAPAVLSVVNSRLKEHLGLIQTLTAIPSHVSDVGGTDRVAQELAPILEDLGFAVQRIPQAPLAEGMEWVAEIMTPGQRQEDLGATYCAAKPGSGATRVLLLGDLDTAFPKSSFAAFPARSEGSLLYGPGIADMKGGLGLMIAALRALDDLGVEMPPVSVVLSGDEQAGSLGSRHVIAELAAGSQYTLCLECSREGGKLMAARGHIGIGDLTAAGRAAHAGSAYATGVNAVEFLARVIPAVNALSRPDDGVLVSVTMIRGGRRRSLIPDSAWAVLDIRTPDALTWEATIGDLQTIVARYGQGRVTARAFNHRPAVEWSSSTDSLLDRIRSIGASLGLDLEAFRSPAAGSSAFAADGGSVVMDGMGPSGGDLMTSGEFIDIRDFAERAAVLAGTILKLRS